jgi:glycerol-3-phosphate dehydrogenase (NAD(P)+)
LADEINSTGRNPSYLTDLVFPATVYATSELEEACADAEVLVLVTPSSAVAEKGQRLASCVAADTPVVLLSKGIEGTTGRLLLDVLADELGNKGRLAVLSGPNHAEEVARGILSGTVIASSSLGTAQLLQKVFSTQAFRVYTSTDIIGVQLCGAAKNIIAISCGIAAGLGYGDNTVAMLMTRGLAEISRLVTGLGGDQITCMGLAGMGDLIATCTSPHSRNRSFGFELAQGGSLETYQKRTHMVVEGALACRTLTALAEAQGVDLPISSEIRQAVWDAKPFAAVVEALVARSAKPEFY